MAFVFNEDQRLMFISGDINPDLTMDFLHAITKINITDDLKCKKSKGHERTPIHLYIQSDGGDVYVQWAIIDSIITSRTPVWTYCNGMCQSAAANIFLAGQKRFAYEHSLFMLHSISWNLRTQYVKDIRVHGNHMEQLQEMQNRFILNRTKITSERLSKIVDNKEELFLDVDQAYALGIVTDIMK